MRSKLKILIALWLLSTCVYAQEAQRSDTVNLRHSAKVEQSIFTSANELLPLWLAANTSGRFTTANAWGTSTNLSFQRATDNTKSLDYFYGAELLGITGSETRFSPIQAYVGLKVNQVIIRLGMQEEFFGVNDTLLTAGNLVYSNNARPIPKAVIQTTDWVRAPILGNTFSFKAYLAHGWFEEDRYQSGALLHQKYLLLRSELFNKRLTFIGGLHHSAQWGGTNVVTESQQPTGLANYARIFMGSSGASGAAVNDQLNALGNHLGTYDFSLSYRFKTFTIRNYWQFIWEDRSGLTPFNWRDGLIGLSVRLHGQQQYLSGFNVELVKTSGQDAVKYNGDIEIIEPDNPFNNGSYTSGWTYLGSNIGNPMFLILNPEAYSVNKVKNMVNGVNVGAHGRIAGIDYKINFLSFKNHGTYKERIAPGLRTQTLNLDLGTNYKAYSLGFRGVIQWGNYPGNNAGMILSIARNLAF